MREGQRERGERNRVGEFVSESARKSEAEIKCAWA